MSGDARRTERFPCVLFATVVKPIPDFRLLISGLCAMLLALCSSTEAQQQAKVPHIGWLGTRPVAREVVTARTSEIIRRELRTLGYVEGKNVAFENRSAEDKPNRLPTLAHELVRLNVAVIVATASQSALAAKNATQTIPIVFLLAGDPVAGGLVDGLARPGGNLTGFTTMSAVLAGKRLEILKETIPKLSRVAFLWDPENRGSEQSWKESQLAARELGLQLHSMEISRAKNSKMHSKKRSRRVAPLSPCYRVRLPVLIKNRSRTWRQNIGCRRYTLGKILSKAAA